MGNNQKSNVLLVLAYFCFLQGVENLGVHQLAITEAIAPTCAKGGTFKYWWLFVAHKRLSLSS